MKSRPSFRIRPQFESLETMELLSAMPLAAEVSAAASAHKHIVLEGSASGTVTSPVMIPASGREFTLNGSGKIAPLGNVQVAGTVKAAGDGHFRATATLKLTDAQGSVLVQFGGPIQKAGASLPSVFAYKIVKGTGAFKDAVGTGKATIQIQYLVLDPPSVDGPVPVRFTLNFPKPSSAS